MNNAEAAALKSGQIITRNGKQVSVFCVDTHVNLGFGKVGAELEHALITYRVLKDGKPWGQIITKRAAEFAA